MKPRRDKFKESEYINILVFIYIGESSDVLLSLLLLCTAQKMRFYIKDVFNKYEQISRKLRICSNLLENSLKENFKFCVMLDIKRLILNTQTL